MPHDSQSLPAGGGGSMGEQEGAATARDRLASAYRAECSRRGIRKMTGTVALDWALGDGLPALLAAAGAERLETDRRDLGTRDWVSFAVGTYAAHGEEFWVISIRREEASKP